MQSDSTTPDPSADAFLASTLRYIQFQKQKGGAVGEKYEAIKVWLAGRSDAWEVSIISEQQTRFNWCVVQNWN